MSKALLMIDFRVMQALDMGCLFLWHFFKVERIWVQRVALSFYGMAAFVSFFVDKPPRSLALSIALGVFFAIGVLVFGIFHWRSEIIAKQPKNVQNAYAMAQRISHPGWRLFSLGFVFIFIFPDILMFDEFSLINIFGMVAWFIMMVGDSIFVSENPPKKWKKVKLPTFVFNTHLPQPQGA